MHHDEPSAKECARKAPVRAQRLASCAQQQAGAGTEDFSRQTAALGGVKGAPRSGRASSHCSSRWAAGSHRVSCASHASWVKAPTSNSTQRGRKSSPRPVEAVVCFSRPARAGQGRAGQGRAGQGSQLCWCASVLTMLPAPHWQARPPVHGGTGHPGTCRTAGWQPRRAVADRLGKRARFMLAGQLRRAAGPGQRGTGGHAPTLKLLSAGACAGPPVGPAHGQMRTSIMSCAVAGSMASSPPHQAAVS